MRRAAIVLLACWAVSGPLQAAHLYKATMVRAAPGKLLELIAFYGGYFDTLEEAGDARPLWMRHSQGDQWDLLILFPLGDFGSYYSAGKARRREAALKKAGWEPAAVGRRWRSLLAWHEDVFVDGPPLAEVQKAFAEAGFFHVEMFQALPGRYDDLVAQRRMENDYLKRLDRPLNQIYTHVDGAGWDCFTIGFYRDLKHFAESVDIPAEREEEAAKAAGFESASAIGPYLRELISQHHDTLAVAVARPSRP